VGRYRLGKAWRDLGFKTWTKEEEGKEASGGSAPGVGRSLQAKEFRGWGCNVWLDDREGGEAT